uniref:F-box protein 42 n=1 Tax=Xenopus tropicalis TaxID=8364 RepID=F6YWZ1_XENTR
MAVSSESEDDAFMAIDSEEGTMEQDEELPPRGARLRGRHSQLMAEMPEEVLEYILSFLSPYQEHKTAALVCKKWYRLIKGACYYDANQSMYVFGGCTQSSCNAAFNDLWRLDLNSKEWIRPLASGSYPSPKAGATLVVYKELLVLFGGWTRPSPYPLHQPERFFDEIHTYSPSKNWWNCIVTTHGPPPMAGHSSCVIGDKMIVFGGSLGSRQMSNDVWVLDLEQWSWSKPTITGSCPHPRGGQSQIVIDTETILILGGCGGPNALFKDAWLLHMHECPWTWQQLKVENEEHGAPELWCHPACRVGQCVVVFSQAPSGRAPLSPSLNSRPSPISATPPALAPDPKEYRSHSPVRAPDEAPCVNGRWGTLRPRAQRQNTGGSREGSLSPARGDGLSPVLNGGGVSPGASLDSPLQVLSPPAAEVCGTRKNSLPEQRDLCLGASDYEWERKRRDPELDSAGRTPSEQTNGLHTPPHITTTLSGAVSPGALRRGLEAVRALASSSPSAPQSGASPRSPPTLPSPGSPSSGAESAPRPVQAQNEGHSLPAIARRLGHHPPQSLNVGKPLYQSMNCKPMQMYALDIRGARERGRVKWKVFNSSSVVGPPETSLHTVVQGRGELIIFGGLMDKKQNVKYYPKTNALYFVRAKR